MNADGSEKANLTHTPDVNEHYPQISPDGAKICFNVDAGEGRSAVRSLWIMDVDGKNRKKIADQAREPFWSPDGKVIGFLHQEFTKFNVVDYFTKGMMFYNVVTGEIEPHPNSDNQPCRSMDGSVQSQSRWTAHCPPQYAIWCVLWYRRLARATAWRRARLEDEGLAAQLLVSLLILRRPCAVSLYRGAAIG